jgi:erythritol transport system permease protein
MGAFLMDQRAFVALFVLVIVFTSMSDTYLTGSNVMIMSKHVAYNAILALGMLLVILTGGIDLSIGATMCLSGIVAGKLLEGWQINSLDVTVYPQLWAVLLISMATGALVGWVNGLLVCRFNVAPFIATLGTMYMARGAALILSNGVTYSHLGGNAAVGNQGFLAIGAARPLGIPTGIWIMAAYAVVIWLIAARMPFGRWLYATGGNERAAELSGVPVKTVKVWVYVVSGLCAATAGIIMVSELTSVNGDLGTAYEMNAIAAVVIGGASLAGGRGSVKGTLVGAFVIGFLADGLVNIKVNSFWQIFIKGLVIVLAVMLDQAQERLKTRRAAAAAVRSSAQGKAPTNGRSAGGAAGA